MLKIYINLLFKVNSNKHLEHYGWCQQWGTLVHLTGLYIREKGWGLFYYTVEDCYKDNMK